MKNFTEGRKMFLSVMAIFLLLIIVFIFFEDYDRARFSQPFSEASDWHLAFFALVVMFVLAFVLNRYAHSMDQRIRNQQNYVRQQMRRELTQNIAHELKTPTSSILGFTETLIDNPDIDAHTRQQFLERCHQQARRLTSLLQDISALNRMEYASDQLCHEMLDLRTIINDVASESAAAMSRQLMRLNLRLPEHIPVRGDPSLLYSVFRNLTDNSIAYAGQGATISITARLHSGVWYFTFADNGAGIASEHLSRLFERFYRIDSGRSRQHGGTGLGLSIVKNAIILHGGSIDVFPANPGLRFDFTLPGDPKEIA